MKRDIENKTCKQGKYYNTERPDTVWYCIDFKFLIANAQAIDCERHGIKKATKLNQHIYFKNILTSKWMEVKYMEEVLLLLLQKVKAVDSFVFNHDQV